MATLGSGEPILYLTQVAQLIPEIYETSEKLAEYLTMFAMDWSHKTQLEILLNPYPTDEMSEESLKEAIEETTEELLQTTTLDEMMEKMLNWLEELAQTWDW